MDIAQLQRLVYHSRTRRRPEPQPVEDTEADEAALDTLSNEDLLRARELPKEARELGQHCLRSADTNYQLDVAAVHRKFGPPGFVPAGAYGDYQAALRLADSRRELSKKMGRQLIELASILGG